MTELKTPHTHGGHGHGGEPAGDRWWANEGDRLVELLEAGATMTSGERAAAERELAVRERRQHTPVVVRREDLAFEPSSFKGVDIGYVVAPHLGMEVRNIQLEIHRLRPGAHTEAYRNGEMVVHVLNGRGHSMMDDQRVDWSSHDSLHIQKGAWYQHANASDDEPAHLLVGRPTPILEHLAPHAIVYKGDSFSDMPDDYKPEHPFTGERVEVGYVGGQKWMSELQLAAHERLAERERKRRAARVLLQGSEAVIQRSEHKGDWKVGLIDEHLGFDNRILAMYVHQMPADSHTETHKHGEAIVYVLSGRGYSIVEGERFEWRAGDCIFVQPGVWHQHFNHDPERVSQHLAIYIAPLRDRIVAGAEAIDSRSEPDYDPPADPSPPGVWWR